MSDHVEWLAGQVVTAGALQNMGGPLTSYSPTVESSGTNPTIGTGAVQQGWYSRASGVVNASVFIQFGTAGVAAGTGNYYVTLPSVAPLLDVGLARMALGSGQIEDASAGVDYIVTPIWIAGDPTTRVRVGVAETVGWVAATSPFTWAASDLIMLNFSYPGDF